MGLVCSFIEGKEIELYEASRGAVLQAMKASSNESAIGRVDGFDCANALPNAVAKDGRSSDLLLLLIQEEGIQCDCLFTG